jgi:hypothetical protein
MEKFFQWHLRKYQVPHDPLLARAITWRSSGNFMFDIDNLYRQPGLRDDAIEDIADGIEQIVKDLKQKSDKPGLVITGHSMGQVLSYLGAHRAVERGTLDIPFKMLTLGGPLGNTNPVYQQFLTFAQKGPLVDHKGKSVDWTDVWNPDDIICSNNLSRPETVLAALPGGGPLDILKGAISSLAGALPIVKPHRQFENAVEFKFDYELAAGAKPLVEGPSVIREHGSYFENDVCFNILKDKIFDLRLVIAAPDHKDLSGP